MDRVAVFGARRVPEQEAKYLIVAGKLLAQLGATVETGNDLGAMEIVKSGMLAHGQGKAMGKVREWLPCAAFRGSPSLLSPPSRQALEIAEDFYPRIWEGLTFRSRRVLGALTHTLLGEDCESKVTFAVCWTRSPDPSCRSSQGIRICNQCEIQLFNLALVKDRAIFFSMMKRILS